MSHDIQKRFKDESLRLQSWDYRRNAAYFVTFCTKNRRHYFGHVSNKIMHLSEIGKIAQHFWLEIPSHFPFIILDAFVIMPNHIHGIILINHQNKIFEKSETTVGIGDKTTVGTLHATSPQPEIPQPEIPKESTKNEKMASISPKVGSLSSVIRSYKSAVSKNAKAIQPDFAWQSRFYDHIIRNNHSFNRIKTYINNNPKNWLRDKLQ